MSLIVVAVGCLMITKSFAQSASESDLCDKNVQGTQAEESMIAAVNAERNPVNRQVIQARLAEQQRADYQRLINYFSAINSGGILQGSRPFAGFTGTLVRFAPNVVNGYDIQIKIDCTLLMKLGTRSMPSGPYTPPTASDVNALRASLSTVNIGDRVVFDGIVYFNSGLSTRSPQFYGPADGLVYSMKLTSIRKQ